MRPGNRQLPCRRTQDGRSRHATLRAAHRSSYDRRVAFYQRTMLIPCPIDATFAFVSDFRNAEKWDPRTYQVDKTTPGPIGVGTIFQLHGSAIPRSLAARLPVPRSALARPLPYEVVVFEPPHRFVLGGESKLLRYRDEIEFVADGDATRMTYSAELALKGALAIGEPFLKLVFKRIGDDATRDIPATVVRGAGAP